MRALEGDCVGSKSPSRLFTGTSELLGVNFKDGQKAGVNKLPFPPVFAGEKLLKNSSQGTITMDICNHFDLHN